MQPPAAAARILVIDDEETFLELITRMLRIQGFEVENASNGKLGLKLIEANSYDLVITDVFMPEKEGLETIREIRSVSPVKILAISGTYDMGGRDLLAISEMLGASASLRKPFDGATLLGVVRELLGVP